MPVTCPNCESEVRGRFCPACGILAREAPCPSCEARLVPGDRFCGECGAPVGSAAAAGVAAPEEPWRPSTTWKVATVALAVVLVVALYIRFAGDRPVPGTLSGSAMQAGAPGAMAVNPLSMPPQQQADAMFDRVMRLSEQGKRDSVQFFAPMALAIYGQLEPLDLDQRFDMGTVALVAGMHDVALAQADTILQRDGDHLLGLALKSRAARAAGRTADAQQADARFASIVETEVKKAPEKTEYQRHKGDIEVEVKRLAGMAP